MKKIIKQIHNLGLKAITEIAKKDYKDITDEDIDKLAESIEFFNDIYEELYDKIFEDSKTTIEESCE